MELINHTQYKTEDLRTLLETAKMYVRVKYPNGGRRTPRSVPIHFVQVELKGTKAEEDQVYYSMRLYDRFSPFGFILKGPSQIQSTPLESLARASGMALGSNLPHIPASACGSFLYIAEDYFRFGYVGTSSRRYLSIVEHEKELLEYLPPGFTLGVLPSAGKELTKQWAEYLIHSQKFQEKAEKASRLKARLEKLEAQVKINDSQTASARLRFAAAKARLGLGD